MTTSERLREKAKRLAAQESITIADCAKSRLGHAHCRSHGIDHIEAAIIEGMKMALEAAGKPCLRVEGVCVDDEPQHKKIHTLRRELEDNNADK